MGFISSSGKISKTVSHRQGTKGTQKVINETALKTWRIIRLVRFFDTPKQNQFTLVFLVPLVVKRFFCF